MNNIYYFLVQGEKPIYIAAPTWKDARNYAYKTIYRQISKLPDIKGFRIKKDCTDLSGVVQINIICEQYAWWKCRCKGMSFVALDANDFCRCINCGKEMMIPTPKQNKLQKE